MRISDWSSDVCSSDLVDIDRSAAARYGLNIADVQAIVSGAIGGETIGETVEGLARYPISVRYPRELRDSLEGLRTLQILTPSGQQITLGTVASVSIAEGPPMLKTRSEEHTSELQSLMRISYAVFCL